MEYIQVIEMFIDGDIETIDDVLYVNCGSGIEVNVDLDEDKIIIGINKDYKTTINDTKYKAVKKNIIDNFYEDFLIVETV